MTPQEAINNLNDLRQYYNDKNEDGYVGFDNEDNEAITMAIQALEQQQDKVIHNHPCEDCYYNDGDVHAECVVCDIPVEDVESVKDQLDGQPCEDAVSRQALIDKATIWDAHLTDSERAVSLSDIMSLPSVTPQPKTGHWVDIMVGDMQAQACDQCKTFYPLAYTGGGHRFCPNCGAQMNGGDEE